MQAETYLRSGETAVAVFTKGRDFELNKDGTGTTGDWVVRANLDVDKVIIYHRKEETGVNEIYVADFDGLSPGIERRHKIHFVNAKLVNNTDQTWYTFADATQNPVRYLTGADVL